MKLLQQLSEAANIPLDQLKDKMKKDPRVKMVFQRSLNLDELKDPVEFVKTIHFYIFNNPKVREWVAARGDRRDFSKQWVKKLANLTNPTRKMDQTDLDWLQELVKALFKDVTYVQKNDLSKRAAEGLHAFVNGNRNRLDAYDAREIESLNLKSSGPVTLYLGLLFDEKSLRPDSYLGYGHGLKFLQSIREGKRIVDLEYDTPTLWTKDKDRALLQALYGSDSSWRRKADAADAEGKIGKHKGQLAFVISTLASPDDVVVDLSLLGDATGWPPKDGIAYSSVILKPGKHVSRIVSRHTPEGEVDPLGAPTEETADLDHIKQLLTMFGRLLKLPFPKVEYEDMSRFTYSPEVMSQLKMLTDPEVKEKVGKLLNATLSFYKKHLQGLDFSKLAGQSKEQEAAYQALRTIVDQLETGVRHRAYANPASPRLSERKAGYVRFSDLDTGDQLLTAEVHDSKAEALAAVIASQKRWTQWDVQHILHGLAEIANPSITFPDKLHLTSWKQQKPFVDAAVDGFYQVIGRPKPESHLQQAKDFLEVTTEATKVARAAKLLQRVRDAALEAGQ